MTPSISGHPKAVLLVFLLYASPARASIVRVEVTSVAGRSVYLNRGRGVGIRPGDRVRLDAPGGQQLDAPIVAVTTNSARADLPPGITLPPVGTKGEVSIADAPVPADKPKELPNDRKVPEHPPWQRKEGPRDPDAPLLSPAFGQRPEERPTTVRGRVYNNLLIGQDNSAGTRSSLSNRTGARIEITNPFGRGGRVLIAGNGHLRNQDDFFGSDSNGDLTLERLSYAIGGEEYSPYRLELGRFYSVHLPELGLIDGVEGALRLQNGVRIGGGVGLYPLPFPGQTGWGDDYGMHLFVAYDSLSPGVASAVLGYQKTWNNGQSDRDQIIARVNLHPMDNLWLFGSCRVDIYDGSERIEGMGVELTEAWLNARYNITDDLGIGGTYSHYAWPDLRRAEYEVLPLALITDGFVDRGSVNGWYRVSKAVRVNSSMNVWQSQDDSGAGGDLGIDLTPRWTGPSFHGFGYLTRGGNTEGEGLRLEARQTVGTVTGYLGYEIYQYRTPGFNSNMSRLRHGIRGGAGWGDGVWSVSLSGDYYFGDDIDAFTIGVYVEYRF